jgi:hypothetical protein
MFDDPPRLQCQKCGTVTFDAEQALALAPRIVEDVHGQIVRREGGAPDDRTRR